MAKFNIDRSKGKVTDIKGNIDTKKKELSDLEKKKQQLIDGRLELDDAHMDEETQRIVAEGLAKAREKIAERGKELSSELDSDASMLEEMAQETDDVNRCVDILFYCEKFGRNLNLTIFTLFTPDAKLDFEELERYCLAIKDNMYVESFRESILQVVDEAIKVKQTVYDDDDAPRKKMVFDE